MLLIVNTLPKDDPAALEAIEKLSRSVPECRVIHAYEMNIRPCAGCTACWLVTPGVCAISDGYDGIMKAYLECDTTVFLAGTALGFVDHRMKHMIDRLLPLATMYIHIVDGQCRHVPRYDKKFRFGLLYQGKADRPYLNEWMERVMLNFGGSSLGAFPISETEEFVYRASETVGQAKEGTSCI